MAPDTIEDEGVPLTTGAESPTELRMGLVLNGGVSLAVWISGVVHELDELRRARAGEEGGYADALEVLHDGARIDVIAGASAGGINGALLAAAIQGTAADGTPQRLVGADRRPLREVWLELGDLRRLTRSPREIDPPSLLRGDDYLLPHLQEQLDGLLARDSGLAHPLYLYVSATDLRGTAQARFSTSGGGFITERDHRVVFRFSANPEPGLGDEAQDLPEGADGDELMSEILRLDRAGSRRLARAARASSSFPGAFAPHRVTLLREDGEVTTFLADGGILDNQPIGPVLDRIRLMKVERPIRRVLLYVVPYVTTQQVRETDDRRRADDSPGLVEVIQAGGLARDLPKLVSLQRAEEELSSGAAAAQVNRVLGRDAAGLVPAADALLPTYRRVQASEFRGTIAQWEATPEIGIGPLGQSDAAGVEQAAASRPAGEADDAVTFASDLPHPDWETATGAWEDPQEPPAWTWGLTKAERFARTAMSWLGLAGSSDPATNAARAAASRLAIAARSAVRARRTAYAALRGPDHAARPEPDEAFSASYDAIVEERDEVRRAFSALVATLSRARGWTPPETRRHLMAAEVCANAAGTRALAPPDFEFYRVSAKGGVLGHRADSPERKLAGMELGHFAAFLKRSWRVNDWMWGRLDAARELGEILHRGRDGTGPDPGPWVRARQVEILREELPALDTAIKDDETAGFSATCAFSLWRNAHEAQLAAIRDGSADRDTIVATFLALDLGDDLVKEESGARATVATATGLAAVGTRAFSSDKSGLPGPVRGLIGATRRTASVTDSLTRTFSRWPAAGFAVILLVAAIAAVLAASSAVAAAWLVPILVAVAVAGAWTGYGWISSPPTRWRWIVLALLTVVLVAANWHVNAPGGLGEPGTWFDGDFAIDDLVWWATIAAALATIAMVVVYALSIELGDQARLARRVRNWLGLGLVSLLALLLGRLAWDRVDDEGSGWENWFENHPAVRALLIAAVVMTLLVQLMDVLQYFNTPRDEKKKTKTTKTPPEARG